MRRRVITRLGDRGKFLESIEMKQVEFHATVTEPAIGARLDACYHGIPGRFAQHEAASRGRKASEVTEYFVTDVLPVGDADFESAARCDDQVHRQPAGAPEVERRQ